MQSQLNMSIVMSLPLKKRPVRIDFSNIEELASSSPDKRCKRESSFSDSSRSGRSSTESSAGSSTSEMMTESAGFSFNPSLYHHSTFIAPLHSAPLPFPFPYNVPLKYSPPVFRTTHMSSEPAVNVCQECGKSFSSKTRYRAHLRRHNSKTSGRYQCKQCDKNFVQRSSLTTHTRIHTGERPFKCNDCSDCFGDYSTFTKHQRTHTGEKPYGCPVCDRKFSQSGNMHRHLKSVH